ncbi:hypothetical protein N781_00715 [Pontibacillus halophilus JSM 076056 = DSM 19796]|uniref:Uncharacterized protein n=1 Tax=Pontibacillus halophilus JSM 076056 = DSM 19796 TaxID=1385510 RepID=A0A0A5GP37_9BACI|nr:hypothetical protein [Pontibacillus halophilus]KGX93759.1 hypothetical protein N781_00715 [Pontibacillus halophilus JSM 076056 = DSM 19796]
MPVSVVFNQIAVNAVTDNSTITTGQSNQPDWSWSGKNNFAAGMNIGVVIATGNINTIFDPDFVDTAVSNPEINNPQPTVQY